MRHLRASSACADRRGLSTCGQKGDTMRPFLTRVGVVGTMLASSVVLAAPAPIYQLAGTEFDANRAGLTIVMGLATAVIVAFVGIKLLRRGGNQVR